MTHTRWLVHFGGVAFTYYTWYHAEQFARALTLNKTPCWVEVCFDA